MYMLTGFHPEFGYQEHYFTSNENRTAVSIALEWAKRSWRPRLYFKTHNSIKAVNWQDTLKLAA